MILNQAEPVDEILASRPPRRPGRVYKLAPGSMGFDSEEPAATDIAAMSATATISTAAADRQGDVVAPRGIRWENYRKNPIVLWEHGLALSLPIAKSEDPQGQLAIAVSDTAVTATAYFTNSLLESEQIFALIVERIVRGASIRAAILESRIRHGESPGDTGLIIDACDLEEWSWVGVPANPEAVAKLLDHNRLADRPIAESIRKSLSAYAAPRAVQGRGWIAADFAVSKPLGGHGQDARATLHGHPAHDPVVAGSPDRVTDPTAGLSSPVRHAIDGLRLASPLPASPHVAPQALETSHASLDDRPLGARLLTSVNRALSEMVARLSAAVTPLENPAVKSHLAGLVEQLTSQQTACRALYEHIYPEQAGLDAEADELVRLSCFKRLAQSPRDELRQFWSQLSHLLDRAVVLHPGAIQSPPDPSTELLGRMLHVEQTMTSVETALDRATPKR